MNFVCYIDMYDCTSNMIHTMGMRYPNYKNKIKTSVILIAIITKKYREILVGLICIFNKFFKQNNYL